MYRSSMKGNESKQIMICAKGYDLYDMDGNLHRENGGSHGMYITGIRSDGKFIVSSWGQEYILDLSNVENNIWYVTIDY